MNCFLSKLSYYFSLERKVIKSSRLHRLGYSGESLRCLSAVSSEATASEGNQQSRDDKFNHVDLMALNDKGEYIIIEVQITGDFDYFRRMLYAVSKTVTEHMKLGMSYKEVKKVYSVNIIYFSLGIKDDYVYHGTTECKGIHSLP